jgi:hypothetical protein
MKLAESALSSSKSQQNPEVLNPPQERAGDILSGIDRVDSKLADCIKMAESTLQNTKQKPGGVICGGSGKTNPRLVQMGPSFSRIPQNPSSKPAHVQTPESAESPFDKDFAQFMNSLDNFEPFDDLEDWSDNVDLFMDAMANPPHHAEALWELAKLKKGKAKAPEQSNRSMFDKPWIKERQGLTPMQSWLHWTNENALRVLMGIPLLAHPKHTY